MNWSGVMPAMTTPFTPEMKVDHAFLAQHAAWQLGNGCDGLVLLGSLGEGAAGWVAGLVNAYPAESVKLAELVKAGRREKAVWK